MFLRSFNLFVVCLLLTSSSGFASAQEEKKADAPTKSAAPKVDEGVHEGEDHSTAETKADGATGAHDGKHEKGGHGAHIGAKGVNKHPEEWRSDLAIFTFLVFCGLMALLTKFAWGPITEALDNRESKIRQDIADAESAKVKSERLLTEHEAKLSEAQEEVKGIIAEARRDAETTKADILATANDEAEATRQRAREDIDHARDVALKELFDSMSARVTGATEHVLGRSLNDQDHSRLIDEALAQFSGDGKA